MPGPQVLAVVAADACTLQNFAVVDALVVLAVRFAGSLVWTEAVRHEVRRGAAIVPALQTVLDAEAGWLGAPARLDGPGDAASVDLIRRGLGGSDRSPLQHLGEAESVRLLERTPATRRAFLTDDREAADMARRRGLHVLDAADILAEAYAMGELPCPAAYRVLEAMHGAGRPVRLPTHRDVC